VDLVSEKKKAKMQGCMYALGAGIWGALASICAKIVVDRDWLSHFLSQFPSFRSTVIELENMVYAARGLAFIGSIVANIYMWIWFTKALQGCKSSVQASVINTSASFLFSVRY
jgi:hypothetical protein